MPISIEADPTLAQGYIKVNGTTAATVTSTGLTTASLQNAAVTPAKLSQPYTLATAQNASGTSIDFTGIPSWAKRITVMLNGVSTGGTSAVQIQLGAGSVTTSGYAGVAFFTSESNNISSGIPLGSATSSAANTRFGCVQFNNVSGNAWVASGNIAYNDASVVVCCAGGIALSGTLDRIRLTTVNGTDTFDAGTINISYEG